MNRFSVNQFNTGTKISGNRLHNCIIFLNNLYNTVLKFSYFINSLGEIIIYMYIYVLYTGTHTCLITKNLFVYILMTSVSLKIIILQYVKKIKDILK